MASSGVSRGRPVSWVALLWLLEPWPSGLSGVEREVLPVLKATVLRPNARDSYWAVSRSAGAETWIGPAVARKVAALGP